MKQATKTANDGALTHVKVSTVNKFYKLPQNLTARNDLNPSDKIVFAVLSDFIGDNEYGWPGIRTLAKATGIFGATVVECLKRLEAAGFINIQRRGNGKSSYYRLLKTVQEIRTVGKSDRSGNLNSGVQEIRTVGKSDRSGNLNSGVQEIRTEAFRKPEPNQTDLLNQTNIKERPNSIEYGLAKLLLSLILSRKPDFRKPDLRKWCVHIDRMIRIDKRSPDRIEAVIRWCQADDFWQNNILSTDKLRIQFDKLELRKNERTRKTGQDTKKQFIR